MKKYVALLMMMAVPAWADIYTALREIDASNPEITAARSVVKASGADVRQSWAGWQPSVGVSAGIARAKTKADQMGIDESYTQKQLGVSVEQNLFQGFSTNARIDAAKGQLQAEQASLYATRQTVFLEAVQAYLNVLNTREVLALRRNNEKVLREYYNLFSQKEQVGVLTKTDVAQAEARLELAKYAAIAAKADYDNALETYRRIYGQTENQYTDVSTDRLKPVFPKTIQEAEQQALANHPSILAADARYRSADAQITVARQTILPSVDVKASAMRFDDIPLADRVDDSRIGVYLTVPLYDKGTALAQTQKAKANASAIKAQITGAQRAVLEKLNQAWNIYQAQTAAITSAQIRIKASRLALDGVRDEQERGRRTVLDVLNAEQEVLDARVSLTQAHHCQTLAFFSVLSGTGALTPHNLGIE